jgi:hypothetical protein
MVSFKVLLKAVYGRWTPIKKREASFFLLGSDLEPGTEGSKFKI